MNASKRAPAEPPVDWQGLIRRFDLPEVRALVLMGSYARGDAGPFSDVDLVRFTAAKLPPATSSPASFPLSLPSTGSHLLGGRLVVVSNMDPEEAESYFVRPELAISRIAGLVEARALRDRDGYFAALQARARTFAWDAAM